MLVADSGCNAPTKRRYDVQLTSVGQRASRVLEVVQAIQRADETTENPDPDDGMPSPSLLPLGKPRIRLRGEAAFSWFGRICRSKRRTACEIV